MYCYLSHILVVRGIVLAEEADRAPGALETWTQEGRLSTIINNNNTTSTTTTTNNNHNLNIGRKRSAREV